MTTHVISVSPETPVRELCMLMTREGVHRVFVTEEMVDRYDAWPFAVKAVSMFRGAEPEFSNGDLTLGEDIHVPLDQFREMYIDYPQLPARGGRTLRLHEVIGISASDLCRASGCSKKCLILLMTSERYNKVINKKDKIPASPKAIK